MMKMIFVNTESECDEKMYGPRSLDEIIADAKKRSDESSGQNADTSDGEKELDIDKHNTP